MPEPSRTHGVLIPSYNSGVMLQRTVEAVAARWLPVWVVVDGSTDGSERALLERMGNAKCEMRNGKSEIQNPKSKIQNCTGVRVLVLKRNLGKGGAVLEGMRAAAATGLTHVLVMDADGQHCADAVAGFMERSMTEPGAMVLGRPVFGPEAPPERVKGRRVGNFFANLATLWGGIEDSLFGFRVYPVAESVRILESIRTARRFDFDTELAVRLYWAGVRPVNLPAPVVYPEAARGGVTHFRYVRDNLLLTGTHFRLFFGMVVRLRRLWKMRNAKLGMRNEVA